MLIVMLDNSESVPHGAQSLGVTAINEPIFEVPGIQIVPSGYRSVTIADIVSLPVYKALKERISTVRDVAITNGVYVPGLGRTLDTDQKSVQRLSGATVIAMLPVLVTLLNREYARAKVASDEEGVAELESAKNAFKTGWIDADNGVFEMGFEELVAISPALGQHEKKHVFEAFEKKAGLAEQVLNAYAAPVAADSDTDASLEVAPVASTSEETAESVAAPESTESGDEA